MMFRDMTADAVAQSVLRLRDELQKRTLADVAKVRLIYANSTVPHLPPDMSYDLQMEYRNEWTPAAIGKTVANKLLAAMYGRVVKREIDIEPLPEQVTDMLDDWDRAASAAYLRAIIHGYTVIRMYPDWRKGVVHGMYDPDEATPIFDSETEALDPIGIIYHYRISPSDFDRPLQSGVKEVKVLEHITVHERDRYTSEVVEPGRRRRWYSIGGDWRDWPYYEGDEGLNPYGDHLGCVVWRNDDSANGPWGESDVLPIYELLQSVSHTATDLKLLLKWNLWPPLASNSPGFSDLPYSWRQIYELAPDSAGNKGEITRLDWQPSSLTGGMDFLRLLLQLICESTGVPAISMGDLSGLGQLSSGRALEVVMMPLTDVTNRRQKLQEYQEKCVIREMLAVRSHSLVVSQRKDDMGVMETINGTSYPNALPIPVSIDFGPLQLSRSVEDAIEYHTRLTASGLESTETAIKSLHPEWTEEQVMEEMDRLRSEQEPREGNVVDETRAARLRGLIDES